ncbi:MAG TPA: copper chaperone PCu(A)C [Rhodanobacteraceae bacterium]|nr:copper chaperone PCu(A)C [Rhodanobacteraceae bacterium]
MTRRLALALLLLLLPAVAGATSTAPTVSAHDAWIRLLPANLPAAGYVRLDNHTDHSARLVLVSSDAFGSIMLHQSLRDGGSQRMRMVDGMDIPAHGSAALEPGSYHLMLETPRHAIKLGERVVMTLHFDDGSELPVAFEVRPANASGPSTPGK